jgi:hypothetical protein
MNSGRTVLVWPAHEDLHLHAAGLPKMVQHNSLANRYNVCVPSATLVTQLFYRVDSLSVRVLQS